MRPALSARISGMPGSLQGGRPATGGGVGQVWNANHHRKPTGRPPPSRGPRTTAAPGPATADGVRIIGTPGGTRTLTYIGELEVYHPGGGAR